MNTATIPDCSTLVQLATDHPEKLDAINEFLKNIIVLVDLTGKAEQKQEHGFTIKTKKVKCNGACPIEPFLYFVDITDGSRKASFMNHGNNVLTLADFASGTNSNGLQFWACRQEPGQLHKSSRWEKGQKRNVELCDMQDFINACLSAPVKYAEEGELTYKY